ncbi:alkaline phosphatase family protein [Bifidobacterium sp. ESL0790]|uniref:alkaline phosphatase family protein n=1 Tax=Bifidobacterium sp. ESL0790 TaxID=2983233 RepID=UPI0023F98DED|nr:alkaline phosphatase family protein [Bifidobacterium sp. ESL0790]WEV72947.1 alkaline phosphatase family protein [Bifidobacterium sp. ESL0790]
MSVEVPDETELLGMTVPATYGDHVGMKAKPVDSVASDGEDEAHQPLAGQQSQRGGALHLSSILPALSASIGSPVATRVHREPEALRQALGFPQARSAIVVLVDGMGYWNLNLRRGHSPYLRSLMGHEENQRPIATCAPSTTVAAMATFGTGTCPGMTGMAGYTERNPQTGALSQLIQFRDALEPLDLQREPTVFEALAERGVRVTSSGLPKFAFSPLTQAALRGTHYISGGSPRQRVLNACKAAEEPGLTYLYIRDADKTGHNYGWHSERWVAAFESIDAQLALLRRFAPKGTLIVITADHGMIQTDPEQRIDIAEHAELSQGVALVGGEPRSVMLYAEPDEDPQAIAERWRDFLGEWAQVRTRDEAEELGMFGPVDARVEPMLGEVLVSAAQSVTIVDTRTQSDPATRLPSVHGSLTHMESDIPCLIDMA